jgi:tetratricopeptide (TPR) repeat protein
MVKQNKIIWQLMTVSVLKKLAWVVLLYAGAAFAQKENKYIRDGNDKYYDDNYKEAEVDYMKALEKNPESVRGQYNLGGALYKQENFEDATKLYGNVVSRASDDQNKADAFYNLGNSYLKAQKYEEAINAYKDALRIDPEDMDTKYNLEYAKKMMQQQQQQQDQQNQDQNKDQENKEEQQQDQQNQDQQQQDQQEKQDQQQQQQQDQQNQDQQQQQQPQPQQISKQDAERMLEALKNDENKTLEKVKLQQMQKVQAKKVEKDW